MIEWSLRALRACGPVRRVVVAAPPGHRHELGGGGQGKFDLTALDGGAELELTVVDGGASRAESVAKALASVETELVAIHDAARPLLTAELLEALVERLEDAPAAAGVIAATPVTDTVKRAAGGSSQSRGSFLASEAQEEPRNVVETLDRSELWSAQTPQVFRTRALREALAAAAGTGEATDEAMLVERVGGRVLIHPSGPENLKVTTPLDLRVAALLLGERSAAED
jgi:2-C-methyl-D-erythritol 4-phosphate cytidylyltransferase